MAVETTSFWLSNVKFVPQHLELHLLIIPEGNMKIFLITIFAFWSASANAWVDGNYDCGYGSDYVISISTFNVGMSTIPFVVVKNGDKTSFKGFAHVEGGEGYKSEYVIWGGGYSIEFLKNGTEAKDCELVK